MHGAWTILYPILVLSSHSSSSATARFNIMMKLCAQEIRRIDAFKRHHYCQHLRRVLLWRSCGCGGGGGGGGDNNETKLSDAQWRHWCCSADGLIRRTLAFFSSFERFSYLPKQRSYVRPSHDTLNTSEDIQIAYTFTNPNVFYLFIWSSSLFRFVVPLRSLKSNRKSNVWLFQSNKSWIDTGFCFIARRARATHTHATKSTDTHSSIWNIIWFFPVDIVNRWWKPLRLNDWKKRAERKKTYENVHQTFSW